MTYGEAFKLFAKIANASPAVLDHEGNKIDWEQELIPFFRVLSNATNLEKIHYCMTTLIGTFFEKISENFKQNSRFSLESVSSYQIDTITKMATILRNTIILNEVSKVSDSKIETALLNINDAYRFDEDNLIAVKAKLSAMKINYIGISDVIVEKLASLIKATRKFEESFIRTTFSYFDDKIKQKVQREWWEDTNAVNFMLEELNRIIDKFKSILRKFLYFLFNPKANPIKLQLAALQKDFE